MNIHFRYRFIIFVCFYFYLIQTLPAQENKNKDLRIAAIEKQLLELAENQLPGLNEKVEFSVSQSSIQEFLRGLAELVELNVNIDPSINGSISNNFKNEKVLNIILFLCREFSLEIEIIGSILSFKPFKEEKQKPAQKFTVKYSAYNDLIKLDVRRDTLYNVLKEIARQSNKNVIAAPEIKDQIISCFVESMNFKEAIKALAFSNDLLLTINDAEAYLLESAEQSFAAKPQRRYANKETNGRTSTYRQDHFRTNIHVEKRDNLVFVSANISNQPLIQVLNSISELSGYNYIFIQEPKDPISLHIVDLEHDAFLELILNATDFTYRVNNDLYVIGGRNEEGLRASELLQLKYRSTSDVIKIIPEAISNGLEIREFNELNGLLLSGSRPQITELKSFIREIDRLVPVVQIEVIVIDVNKGRDLQTGITAGISDSIPNGGTLLPGLDFTLSSASINGALDQLERKNIINLGKVNPNFYTNLKALEQNNNINIRSTPKLATLNGHEATLTIGRTEFYLEQTQNIQGANNIVTTVTPQYREISADLNIVINPIVSANEHVTLDIAAEFSDFTPAFVPNGPPGKASRKFNSLIRVRNNEMIVLGGLEEESKIKNASGIPILARIPVLNWIFSARSNTKSNTRLLVFIRPTILY
ncbi:type II and III secretion system protein [Hyphobacterium sp. CCMP332]|nr:type II and III secretion system protein [Hyphobacterium sp. CCMP332]